MTSTFASNEYQAVQFMPVVIVPQFLLSGVLVPRDTMLRGLELVSNILPLSYVIDALRELAIQPELGDNYWKDVGILMLFIVGILVVAALSMPRQTT
jgi:putative transporter